jgi:hypothetical protein
VQVVIGGWGNTASVIRYGTEGTDLVHFQGPQLSETEFRPFWVLFLFRLLIAFAVALMYVWLVCQISLANGVMSVGNGHRFGASQFMSALVPRIGGVHELYIGWAAWDTALTFRYKGATSSCMRIDYNPFDDVVPTTPPPKPPAPTDCTVSDWFWSMSQTPVRPDPYGNITIHDSECSTRCGGGFARQERHILVKYVLNNEFAIVVVLDCILSFAVPPTVVPRVPT